MAGRWLSDAGGQKTGEFRMGQFHKWAEQLTIDLCQAAGGGDSVRAEMAGRRLSDAGGRKTTATSTMYYILCTIAGAAIDRAPSFSSGYSMSLFGFIHTELMHICQKHGKKDLLMASHKSHIL